MMGKSWPEASEITLYSLQFHPESIGMKIGKGNYYINFMRLPEPFNQEATIHFIKQKKRLGELAVKKNI